MVRGIRVRLALFSKDSLELLKIGILLLHESNEFAHKVLRNCAIASSYRRALEVANGLRRFSGNFAYSNRQ
jgi:hypothetical protein